MNRLFLAALLSALLVAMPSLSWAATQLNSSKSNIYRVIYDPSVANANQVSALLAELDKLGPADEATLKKWLPANFKKHGIQAESVKKTVILPASNTRKNITIIFLKNPADESRALAVSDEGVQGPKKSGAKKN